jgi:hypothetical protein
MRDVIDSLPILFCFINKKMMLAGHAEQEKISFFSLIKHL